MCGEQPSHRSREVQSQAAGDGLGGEERAAENELPPLDSPQQLAEWLGITVQDLRWFAYHRDAALMSLLASHMTVEQIQTRDARGRTASAPTNDGH